MKRLLYFLSLILMVVVPVSIMYFNYDTYAQVSAERLRDILDAYLYNIRFGIETDGLDFQWIIKMMFWTVIGYVIIDKKFIENRRSGLHLLERRGDWILSLWFIIKMTVIWYIVYWFATYLHINTDKWIESTNGIFICVAIGIVCNLISTYLYNTSKR